MGCKPWQTGVVGGDGSSPWQRERDADAKVIPLTSWASFETVDRYLQIASTFASSNRASTTRKGLATTLTTNAPLLARSGEVYVKITAQNVVYSGGGLRAKEATDPRVQSRRYVCMPYTR
jgi:hypothetical protein